MQACTKPHHFEIKKMQKFSGEGGHPLPRPHPLGAYGASIFASTALKLNVTPHEKKILVRPCLDQCLYPVKTSLSVKNHLEQVFFYVIFSLTSF